MSEKNLFTKMSESSATKSERQKCVDVIQKYHEEAVNQQGVSAMLKHQAEEDVKRAIDNSFNEYEELQLQMGITQDIVTTPLIDQAHALVKQAAFNIKQNVDKKTS